MRIVFVGHVDHGKSTLIGRLLTETGSIPKDRVESVQAYCKKQGKKFEYAFLLDALQEEQEQGITIDTTQIYFKSKIRNYMIIDAPGHKEFLKNMISGASTAETAVLMIDANEGIREQSKRHGYILSLLGIKQVIIAVNKMDLVGYKQIVFDEIEDKYRKFLELLNVNPSCFIPISAPDGDNVVKKSTKMKWYKGQTIIQAMDSFSDLQDVSHLPLRFPVQDVYKFDDRRIIAGRIESGMIKIGDEICFSPSDKKSKVISIEKWSVSSKPKQAQAGESVGITISDELFIERGAVIYHQDNCPLQGNVFSANIFWMGKIPFSKDKKYIFRLATIEQSVQILNIKKVIDAETLKPKKDKSQAKSGDIVEVVLKVENEIPFDEFKNIPALGRFVLIENNIVSGGGIIVNNQVLANRKLPQSASKMKDYFLISPTESLISIKQRNIRNKHVGKVIWISGIPGSGRNTIAKGLEKKLFQKGYQVYLISGANLRYGLSSDLGFSDQDRHEQARRLAEVSRMMVHAGIIVIISSVSPFAKDRARAKKIIGSTDFIEIQTICPLNICKKRNPHGVFQDSDLISGFDAEYEPIINPDIEIDTSKNEPEESVEELMAGVIKYL